MTEEKDETKIYCPAYEALDLVFNSDLSADLSIICTNCKQGNENCPHYDIQEKKQRMNSLRHTIAVIYKNYKQLESECINLRKQWENLRDEFEKLDYEVALLEKKKIYDKKGKEKESEEFNINNLTDKQAESLIEKLTNMIKKGAKK